MSQEIAASVCRDRLTWWTGGRSAGRLFGCSAGRLARPKWVEWPRFEVVSFGRLGTARLGECFTCQA
ncbi:unnamed protein product [Protopolystoma xenopodis]|uniref:Uncharacterized protein n=1 Tax=Protopolystoma xenopodis TaxID=117903 RepID=A0A448X5F1_9PLAT|nr:unnamed protein product [Protopolystoma xenopodis]